MLDLIPAPIFWGELMLLYFSQNSHIQRREIAINKFLAGAAFTCFLSPDLDSEPGYLSINEA